MSHPICYNLLMKMKNENTKTFSKWGAAVMANFADLHALREAGKKAEAKNKGEGSKGTRILTQAERMER